MDNTATLPTEDFKEAIDLEAFRKAKLEEEQEKINYSSKELQDQEEHSRQVVQSREFEDNKTSIDREVAQAFKEIKGPKKFIFDKLLNWGIDFYKAEVRKYQQRLQRHEESLLRYVGELRNDLHNKFDDDPQVNVNKKGLGAQLDHYTKTCTGISYMIQQCDRDVRQSERMKAEHEVKLGEYNSKLQSNPDDEEASDLLQYYQQEVIRLSKGIVDFQRKKKKLGLELVRNNSIKCKVAYIHDAVELNLMEAEEFHTNLKGDLTIIDFYIDRYKGGRSLSSFQSDMKDLMQLDRSSKEAIGIFHNGSVQDLDRNVLALRNANREHDPRSYQNDVQQKNNKLMAENDQLVKSLVEEYTHQTE
tara:strand:+ start:2770 stop:3849 length:1080 start_codon:yes stop_codon:yes gene_type:complete